MKLNTTFAAAMAAIAVCPIGAVAEVYSCEIKEWVRVNDEGLVRPAPSAPFKRHVSIDKETGNAVGDALSVANRWEIAQKGSQENAFVTLGYVGSRLIYEIAVYEFNMGREKPLIIAVRSRRGLFFSPQWNLPMMFRMSQDV